MKTELLLNTLKQQGKTLATAESCTGGGIGHRLTAIPGSSAAYAGGVISYTNAVKQTVLGVPEKILETKGAVSAETARAMAEGVRRVIGTVEQQRGRRFAIRHCANSGAVASWPESYMDMVRPGILLYGCGELAERLGLRPVMTLKTTVSTIKIYGPGTDVSYGRLYTTPRTTRMGVVPYGYADGFFRCLSGKCAFAAKGGDAPQRGRICMDMSMVDLTDLPEVQVGDELEVFGAHHPVGELAALADTIPYELVCAVSRRVPRVYLQNGAEVERELLLRF